MDMKFVSGQSTYIVRNSDRGSAPMMAGSEDRRVLRTRRALTDAFSGLVLERRYGDIRIQDILERADIGRSTFYAHFQGKDDLLVQSLEPILAMMAEAIEADCDLARIERLLQHFWDNRERGRSILMGPPVQPAIRALSQKLEGRLEALCREDGGAAPVPLRMIANQIATAQFALVQTWIAGEASCPVETLARTMHKMARGMVVATVFNDDFPASPLTSPPNRPNALG
jgi:AcrR family transcriptional regulator